MSHGPDQPCFSLARLASIAIDFHCTSPETLDRRSRKHRSAALQKFVPGLNKRGRKFQLSQHQKVRGADLQIRDVSDFNDGAANRILDAINNSGFVSSSAPLTTWRNHLAFENLESSDNRRRFVEFSKSYRNGRRCKRGLTQDQQGGCGNRTTSHELNVGVHRRVARVSDMHEHCHADARRKGDWHVATRACTAQDSQPHRSSPCRDVFALTDQLALMTPKIQPHDPKREARGGTDGRRSHRYFRGLIEQQCFSHEPCHCACNHCRRPTEAAEAVEDQE